jgi:uncharacterized OB-fold protein
MTFPQPVISPVNVPFWSGLKEGRLLFQECRACGHRWLPPREACPGCLSADVGWKAAAGTGKVVSWVIYHTAYHEAFKQRLPYNVACVELDEGPRLLTNIIGADAPAALAIDARVALSIEHEGDLAVARFRLASPRS